MLGTKQYYPDGSLTIPENRLFAQFHASQTTQMKDQILQQVCSATCKVRVIFATVALGMGVDVPSIRHAGDSHQSTLQREGILPRLRELAQIDNLHVPLCITTTGTFQKTE